MPNRATQPSIPVFHSDAPLLLINGSIPRPCSNRLKFDQSIRANIPTMEDKRHIQRHRTLKGARIAFQGDGAAIQCVVRNLSDEGACLVVESPVGIPDKFHLIFDSDEPDRQCKVVWRSKNRIGVAFG
jgi:hypothetical protein